MSITPSIMLVSREVLVLVTILQVASIEVDGNKATPQHRAPVLPATARELDLHWTPFQEAMPLHSHETVAADYQAEYKRRYEEFVRTGK